MITLNGTEIKPTIFPDKTSQVWKINESSLIDTNWYSITWNFEQESELIHVLQLADLLKTYNKPVYLHMSYLPYARQDKTVSNVSTFSLKTFIDILKVASFDRISVLDPHNASVLPKEWGIVGPEDRIEELLKSLDARVCFPDKGASLRYNLELNHAPVIASKVRNQLTGEIEGMVLDQGYLSGAYLIVDDLCDGGRTFIEASNLLYKAGADSVYLYTTHGLYTKGVGVLKEAGIKRVFNYTKEE